MNKITILVLLFSFLLANCQKKSILKNDRVEANNTEKVQTIHLNQYTNNTNYFIKTFDVNKDGIKDKIVSHNRYLGDELLLFLGDKRGNYNWALKSTNFSEDGGNQISDIKETKEGFEIITQFPDRGYLQNTYWVSGINNKFILTKIQSESESWQDGYTEKCSQNINVDLKKSITELSKVIGNTKKKCTKIYNKQSKIRN
ncbi:MULTISPECIES: hypothetical protein [Chryseobacterium]|uniref:hypothetical protein n=1 Tax=Chryseobacterium TaxID=59732 RepID=UPI001958A48A|nr:MULTISPECIES: hypothetical protein [Chryseobacterium]MBM7421451.1 hypothetical protein [Chryseobacterium sp. JUb44]MDH6211414.1 hypothetical protein [Chryseobacterium sp. BIGb0186]WSO10066.1 hypothetical protein VUJ64_19810 [Chryseobacterium scophthalmum]